MTSLLKAERLAMEGCWRELEEWIDCDPDLVCAQDASGRTLLLLCARLGGSAAVLRKLIELGADPNHRAHDGSNALAAAIGGDSRYGLTTLPELRTLLESGADPEAIADSGMPALHWAIAQARPEHALVLLEHGASLDTLTSDSPPESVEDIARRMGSIRALKMLDEWRKAGQRR